MANGSIVVVAPNDCAARVTLCVNGAEIRRPDLVIGVASNM